MKERGKAASLLDPETEMIFGADLKSIDTAAAEAKQDLSRNRGVEVAAFVTVENEASAAPKAASMTFIGGPQASSLGFGWHQRSSIVVMPPPLMAAMFPWNRLHLDRKREIQAEKGHNNLRVASDALVLDVGEGVVTMKLRAAAMAEDEARLPSLYGSH